MKNIIQIISDPELSIAFQDALGQKNNRYLRVSSLRELRTTLEILDPKKPDLIVVDADGDKELTLQIADEFPDLQKRIIVATADTEFGASLMGAGISAFRKNFDINGPFLEACRQTLAGDWD